MVEQSHLANNGGRKKDEREGEENRGREKEAGGKDMIPQRHDSKDLPL